MKELKQLIWALVYALIYSITLIVAIVIVIITFPMMITTNGKEKRQKLIKEVIKNTIKGN